MKKYKQLKDDFECLKLDVKRFKDEFKELRDALIQQKIVGLYSDEFSYCSLRYYLSKGPDEIDISNLDEKVNLILDHIGMEITHVQEKPGYNKLKKKKIVKTG